MPYIIVAALIVFAIFVFFSRSDDTESPSAAITQTEESVVADAPAEPALEAVAPEVTQTPETSTETPPAEVAAPDPVAASQENDFNPADDQRTVSAEASYLTPARKEHVIDVTLTLKDRVVTDAVVTYDGGAAATPSHSGFDAAYRDAVVGKKLNEVSLSRVGGASLTSEAFNDAVAQMRAQS